MFSKVFLSPIDKKTMKRTSDKILVLESDYSCIDADCLYTSKRCYNKYIQKQDISQTNLDVNNIKEKIFRSLKI